MTSAPTATSPPAVQPLVLFGRVTDFERFSLRYRPALTLAENARTVSANHGVKSRLGYRFQARRAHLEKKITSRFATGSVSSSPFGDLIEADYLVMNIVAHLAARRNDRILAKPT